MPRPSPLNSNRREAPEKCASAAAAVSGATPSSTATANAAAALSALCRPGTWRSSAEGARRRRDPRPAGSFVVQPDGGVGRRAVKDHAGVAAGQGALCEGPGPGVVRAGHQDPVCREQGREAVEGGIHGVGGAVEVQVVRLDVGHHGDRGPVIQEGAVRFVSFGDEDPRGAVGRIDAERRNVGADGEGRVQPGALQKHRDHRGGGGLAVRSGDGHHGVIGHGGGQGLGAVQHRRARRRGPLRVRGCPPGSRSRPPPSGRRRGCPAPYPTAIVAPAAARSVMTGRALASDPLTGMPRATMMRATADMPTPPMPMKCTRPREARERVECWGLGHGFTASCRAGSCCAVFCCAVFCCPGLKPRPRG